MAVDLTELLAFAAEFEAGVGTIEQRSLALVDHWGHIAAGAIAARAPGTHYPSTIHAGEPFVAGTYVGITVSTDRLDGFRREFGFHGTDSLGRHYSQAGTPHFVPGIDAVEVPFNEACQALIADA